jgi:hypothetical protein
MSAAERALYGRLIERETADILPLLQALATESSLDGVWRSVTRFAVLAFAPSLHAARALTAARAAWELTTEEVLPSLTWAAECARYAALSRQPWSEPPLLEPPAIAPAHPSGPEELREAVETSDRLRAEKWLAAAGTDAPAVLRREAAGEARLLLDTAEWLLPRLGEKGRHALLRPVVWQMASGRPAGQPRPLSSLLELARERRGAVDAVAEVLAALAGRTKTPGRRRELPPQPYPLARDFGQTLIAHALASRLDEGAASILLAVVRENLEHGESYEDWSFA